MTDTVSGAERGFRGFMNRGGPWRFLAYAVVYVAVYLAAGRVAATFAEDLARAPLLTSVGSVFVQLTFALIVGAIILVGTAFYLGWTKELFGRQPIYRSRWMWLAPAIVAIPIVLRVLGIEWGRDALPVVVLVLASGLLIGFVEELLFRGIAIKTLRNGGLGEWAVAALSSLFFALSHSVNLLSGQSLVTVAPTVVYTFAFGVLMYLTLRSFGFLIAAMILHGLTDPTTILSSGGIDEITTAGSANAFLTATGPATLILTVSGFILLIFIRGRVARGPVEQST